MAETSQKPSGFMKQHRKLIIALVILAIAIIAAIITTIFLSRRSAAGRAQAPQTITLETMNIEQVVSGTGTIKSSRSREVSSSLSYEIKEVYVKAGDYVESGDRLAKLDDKDIAANITKARKSIKDAEAQDALALEQYNRKLDDAIKQHSLDSDRLAGEISKANSSLATANQDRDSAKADMDSKKAKRDQAQSALSAYPQAGDPGYSEQRHAELESSAREAETAYNSASQTYESKKQAQSQSQSQYDSAVQQKDSQLRQDNIAIENARDAVNSQKLRDTASATRTQLDSYLDEQKKCTITAPISGTVTSAAAEAGKRPSSGGLTQALFTIEDTSSLEISSSIPEYDVEGLEVGMSANITSDAMTGKTWKGTVKSLSPKATDESNNFTAIIEVEKPADGLKIGMSAKINIVTASKKGVYAVPYDAVTMNAYGEAVVYAIKPSEANAGQSKNASLVEIKVKTGMESDYYIEITGEGLYSGLVINADPENKNMPSSSGGPGFGPMGGF